MDLAYKAGADRGLNGEAEFDHEIFPSAQVGADRQGLRFRHAQFKIAPVDFEPRIAFDANRLQMAIRAVAFDVETAAQIGQPRFAPIYLDMNLAREIVCRDRRAICIESYFSFEALDIEP